MELSKSAAGGIALGILVLGIGIGKFATPAKTIERDHIVTNERDTELSWHAFVGHTESKIKTKTQWKTVTKWEKDGSVVQTQVAVQDHKEQNVNDVKENDGQIKKRVVKKIVDHEKIVEAKKPDWLFGAGVGTRFDKLAPVYEASVERRILGLIFIGVQVQASGPTREGAAAFVHASMLF
jgi:hypothetical protein